MPLAGAVLRVVSSKRRYRCSDCRWTGWRHRLTRHGGPALADQVFDAHEVPRREVWYFVVVAVVFALFLGTVMKQCSDAAPIPPDDISRLERPAAVSHLLSAIEIRSVSRLPRV